jgi:hypothetical protein
LHSCALFIAEPISSPFAEIDESLMDGTVALPLRIICSVLWCVELKHTRPTIGLILDLHDLLDLHVGCG